MADRAGRLHMTWLRKTILAGTLEAECMAVGGLRWLLISVKDGMTNLQAVTTA